MFSVWFDEISAECTVRIVQNAVMFDCWQAIRSMTCPTSRHSFQSKLETTACGRDVQPEVCCVIRVGVEIGCELTTQQKIAFTVELIR